MHKYAVTVISSKGTTVPKIQGIALRCYVTGGLNRSQNISGQVYSTLKTASCERMKFEIKWVVRLTSEGQINGLSEKTERAGELIKLAHEEYEGRKYG